MVDSLFVHHVDCTTFHITLVAKLDSTYELDVDTLKIVFYSSIDFLQWCTGITKYALQAPEIIGKIQIQI